MVWIGKYTTRYGDYFYFAFRIIIGFVFMLHGAQKIFGSFGGLAGDGAAVALFSFPAGLAGIIELFGGALIIIGLFTRWAALIGAIEMLIAYFLIHIPAGWVPLMVGGNNGELVVLFFASFLMILVYGARKWGLDKVLFRNIW